MASLVYLRTYSDSVIEMNSFRILAAAAVIFASAWSVSACAQQMHPRTPELRDTVDQRNFFSAALQRDMPYEVILPADYAKSQQHYPVLYLLHGWQGDETNWVKLTQLVEDASQYRLIIIAPRAENSWYVNSATNPEDRYADYIVHDLIADIDAHYRTIADVNERAIAGLSMGGYGALLLTLRHPGIFGFAASVSGAFSAASGIEAIFPAVKPSTDEAFGPADSATRKENDLDPLIGRADPSKTPYLFLMCGTRDPLLKSNRHVVAELSSRDFAYEYHELPGAHTWSFWDSSLPPLLTVVAEELHIQRVELAISEPSIHSTHKPLQ